MRVGTGARLDGVLTDAVRNFVLSNSIPVFQGSYQTSRLRDDLTKLAFGENAGCNDDLFQDLSNISLSRDARAPIYPSKEGFEGRSDVTAHRTSLEAAKKIGDVKALNSTKLSLEALISTLSNLKIQENRTEYFKCADDLRARGLSTKDCVAEFTVENPFPRKSDSEMAAAIAYHFEACTRGVDEWSSTKERSKCYMFLLVNYLARRSQLSLPWQAKIIDLGSDSLDQQSDDEVSEHGRKFWKWSRCLLCCDGKNKRFRGRGELTRHYQTIHIRNGTFNRPFPCPECVREGLEEKTIEGGASARSHHVEEVHRKYHTPYLPSDQPSPEGYSQCLFCGKPFTKRGLTRQVNKAHGKSEVMIDGEGEWDRHVGLFHGESEEEENHESRDGGKRRRDEEDAEDVFETGAAAVAVDVGWVAVNEWLAGDEEYFASDEEWSDAAIANTAITTPNFLTDSIFSGSQSPTPLGSESPTTPTSSENFDDVRNIDPRILADELGKGWKRTRVDEEPPTVLVGESFPVPLRVHSGHDFF
ncbi:MAG: hypothetical protein MMC33_009527 [Icmadophila ericetorum]|nr:hypothetical protein [Icmadophila ericetorum]